MRVLHLLNDGPETAPRAVLELQRAESELEVIDLSSMEISYEDLVDKIFTSDKVISW